VGVALAFCPRWSVFIQPAPRATKLELPMLIISHCGIVETQEVSFDSAYNRRSDETTIMFKTRGAGGDTFVLTVIPRHLEDSQVTALLARCLEAQRGGFVIDYRVVDNAAAE
jgi:hypothetical protein